MSMVLRVLSAFAVFAWASMAVPAWAQAPTSWTGFYVGGHLGYGWARQSWTQIDNNQGNALDRSIADGSGDRVLGGLQAGYNQQYGAWVLGVEGDWSWTRAEGCAGLVIFFGYSNCSQAQWYATIAGRAGYVFDRTLVYAKGGVAFTRQRHFANFGSTPDTTTTSQTATGWLIGGGLEVAVDRNWTARIEYNYLDFGTDNVRLNYLATGTSPGLIEHWDARNQVHAVKFGINYLFGAR
jgi:outer membrane immunogenic protein